MSQPTPEPAAQPAQTTEPTGNGQPDPAQGEQATTDWQAEARKWEARAKENRKAAEELERARKAQMSESERAVAEAEERGRTEARTQMGERLVRTEILAAAARRNPTFDTEGIMTHLNLGGFLGEDLEPDTKAIAKAVETLVPASSNPGVPDLGMRAPAPPAQDMSAMIRAATGRK